MSDLTAAPRVSIDELVRALRALPASTFDHTEEVRALLAKTPVSEASLAPFLTWDRQHYTRNLIDKTELYELMAICWDVGQSSSVHNHRDQNCWMAAAMGRLLVENFHVGFQDLDAGKCQLQASNTVELTVANPCAVDPREPVHRVVNPREAGQRAVTLHVYSRPFDSCVVYSPEQGTCGSIRLFYNTIFGKEVPSSQYPAATGPQGLKPRDYAARSGPAEAGPFQRNSQGGIVRKYVGVLAGVAALCVMSWAQAPAQAAPADQAPAQAPAQTSAQAPTTEATPIPTPTPTNAPVAAAGPKYPRIEFFAGGTYAEAGLFNAGHWAGLPGWDASLGLNATSWIGVVFDGGQYFGTSKIPTSAPAPFPTCGGANSFCPGTSPTFNVSTREYNFLFGLQFARRKYEMWTPIGELMYGHQGTRGVATGGGETVSEVSSGRALVAGGGLDRRISDRFALRIKADYLQTGSFKQKQDNFRVSVGIVIRNVHKKKRTLEDETQVEP